MWQMYLATSRVRCARKSDSYVILTMIWLLAAKCGQRVTKLVGSVLHRRTHVRTPKNWQQRIQKEQCTPEVASRLAVSVALARPKAQRTRDMQGMNSKSQSAPGKADSGAKRHAIDPDPYRVATPGGPQNKKRRRRATASSSSHSWSS